MSLTKLSLGGNNLVIPESLVTSWLGTGMSQTFFYCVGMSIGQIVCCLKVHKHEIILNFFLTEIKSLYGLRKFSKKISLLFLRFSPEIRCSNISPVTEHTRNQIFFERYPKNFFPKIFTMVLLDRFLDGF
jgi:hypothetical protein